MLPSGQKELLILFNSCHVPDHSLSSGSPCLRSKGASGDRKEAQKIWHTHSNLNRNEFSKAWPALASVVPPEKYSLDDIRAQQSGAPAGLSLAFYPDSLE